MQDPNDLEVVFGASAVFKCSAQGDPTPEINWMRNSNEIDSSDSRVRVASDGTLQIDRIDARDQGVYTKGAFKWKIDANERPIDVDLSLSLSVAPIYQSLESILECFLSIIQFARRNLHVHGQKHNG